MPTDGFGPWTQRPVYAAVAAALGALSLRLSIFVTSSGWDLNLTMGILKSDQYHGTDQVVAARTDLFGSQIQGDLIGVAQWRIYQGAAKEFGSATSGSFCDWPLFRRGEAVS